MGGPDTDLTALLNDVQTACKYIASAVARGPLRAANGGSDRSSAHSDPPQPLDLVASDIILRSCEWGGELAGMVSEELPTPHEIPPWYPRGRYLLAFDALDGASNLDVNASVGTIFSVLRAPEGFAGLTPDHFLQAGTSQVAAGYALYGPAAMIVLTLGRGVHAFTHDPEIGAYILSHSNLRVPETTREFAINASNERYWERPVRRYVHECIAGRTGPREGDFSMRWIASLIAEVHRILIRGGLFMYPKDTKGASKNGRMRLLYEASPMAMLIEQASGCASTGRERILDIVPKSLHERVPLILGSRCEVERLERYHREADAGVDQAFESPLFNTRSLFRDAVT